MNSMVAVADDSIDASGRGGIAGPAVLAVFALVGLILLFAAFRLVRKRHEPQRHRYTLPGH
jgi:hypothetical protein